MSAPPVDRVVGIRGTATPDELAAVLAALAHRPVPVADRYEQWRRSRVAAVARTRSAAGPQPRARQIRRPQPPRLPTWNGRSASTPRSTG
jgi:hypothetical protein